MNASKKFLAIVVMVTVAAFMGINGCKKSSDGEVKNAADLGAKTSESKISGCPLTKGSAECSLSKDTASVALCTKCGQIKGTDLCCKPDQPKCSGCSLAKGSPGCCKIPKDATSAALCTKCGHIKGTELCCKADQPKCSSCSLAKGSPGCCKLPKI